MNDMDEVEDQAIPKLLDERGLNLINRACADNSYSLASFVVKFVRDRHLKRLQNAYMNEHNIKNEDQIHDDIRSEMRKQANYFVKDWINTAQTSGE